MAKITNTSKKNHDVTLPDGTVLKPGKSADVAGFDEQYKDNAVIKAWRKAGIIKVEASEVAPVVAPKPIRTTFNDDKL